MTLEKILILARKHIGSGAMESQALLCLEDAFALKKRGNFYYAKLRAIRSLEYSVGISHPDYKEAAAKI